MKFHSKVLVTFHPSYLARTYNLPTIMIVANDFNKALNPPPVYKEDYILDADPITAMLNLDKYAKDNDGLVEVDIETKGDKDSNDALDPYKAQITGIAFSPRPGQAMNIEFSEGTVDPKWNIVRDFLQGNTPKAFHNGIFDDAVMRVQQNVITKNIIWDTRDGASIIYSDLKQNLDLQRSLYTSVTAYKKELAVEGKKHPEMGYYGGHTKWANCKDVDTQYQVYVAQRNLLTENQKALMKRIVNYDRIAVDMRVRGVTVNLPAMIKHKLELEPKIVELESAFFDKYQCNPNSPKQVGELLFETLKFPPPRGAKTEKGAWSTGEDIIEELKRKCASEEDKVVLNQIIDIRSLKHSDSHYVSGAYKLIYPDGKVHSEWIPTASDTGRWSCQGPNLQNQPLEYRDQYMPSPGKIFFISDFKGLEFLIMLIKSGDFENAEKMLAGMDVHGETQVEMNKTYPCDRVVTKGVVFGTAYGLKPTTIARDFGVTKSIAEQWQQVAIGRFPKIKEMADKHVEQFEKLGYVETMYGRRKYAESINQARNSPIQGTAADICGDALIALDEKGWHPVMAIHDEVVCEEDIEWATEEKLQEFISIVETAATSIYRRFPVSAVVSYQWEKG